MSKLFKVGDKVGTMWGDGAVEEDCEGCPVGVLVVSDGVHRTFTNDGLYRDGDTHPSIWHLETGSAPVVGERPFNYPIFKKRTATGLTVKFVALTEGVVVEQCGHWMFGEKSDSWTEHTDSDIWEDL